MNVEDLMFGDWVIRKGIPSEPMQIAGFNKFRNLVYMDFTGLGITETLDGIEPIPLTAKILEKNGFTMTKDQYQDDEYYLLGKNEYNIKVYWLRGTILLVEDEYEPTTYAYVYDCEYVHELQHILKHFKIKKEIKL